MCPERGSRTRHNGPVSSESLDRSTQQRNVKLRHVLVAGGTVEEWAAFSEVKWKSRLDDLVWSARRGGASFVTVHPHETSESDDVVPDHTKWVSMRRSVELDGIGVVVDPVVDGRDRIVDVVSKWPNRRRLTEKRLSKALFGEAGEPDLVVVLGPDDRLPSSLVWELAYGELVFLNVRWSQLSRDHLGAAIDDYASRRRRFGGVD